MRPRTVLVLVLVLVQVQQGYGENNCGACNA